MTHDAAQDQGEDATQAATLMLVRDTAKGLEVFMIQRHHKITFAGGALVFPGGKLDPGDLDASLHARCDGVVGLSVEVVAQMVAAIRETFEESGYLLARREGHQALLKREEVAALQPQRQQLLQATCNFGDFVQSARLRLACDQLHPFARWITPKTLPRQFDTHFYLARVPPGQEGKHDGSESIASLWATPEGLLQQSLDEVATIIFPTRMNLRRLRLAASVDVAIQQSQQQPIVTVRPWIEERPTGAVICIPANAGYDATEDQLQRILREEGIDVVER